MKVTQVEAAGGKGRRLAATQSREIGGEGEVAVELAATDLAFVVSFVYNIFSRVLMETLASIMG